jgi:hypothetical protein
MKQTSNNFFTVTAGVPCPFSIIARDRFGNFRFSNSKQQFFYLGQYFSRVPFHSAASFAMQSSPMSLQIRSFVIGIRTLSVLLLSSHGVLVEYFANEMHWTVPIYSEITNGILPHDHLSVIARDQYLKFSKYPSLGVRWTGYLHIAAPQQLTFLLNSSVAAML